MKAKKKVSINDESQITYFSAARLVNIAGRKREKYLRRYYCISKNCFDTYVKMIDDLVGMAKELAFLRGVVTSSGEESRESRDIDVFLEPKCSLLGKEEIIRIKGNLETPVVDSSEDSEEELDLLELSESRRTKILSVTEIVKKNNEEIKSPLEPPKINEEIIRDNNIKNTHNWTYLNLVIAFFCLLPVIISVIYSFKTKNNRRLCNETTKKNHFPNVK